MTRDLSKYFGNKIVRWIAGQAMPTAPSSVYVALFSGDPTATGSEVTTTVRSAGRVAVTWTVPAENDTDNALTNSTAIDFGSAAADCDFDYIAIFTASTGGKRLGSKALADTASVVSGQPVSFGAGELTITVGS